MLKTIIRLPDGTEISSGAGEAWSIRSATHTECVNSGTELTIGSVCSACLELEILDTVNSLSLIANDRITLVKEDGAGQRTQMGIFRMEKPTKASANVYKVTAYDAVSYLDRDLTEWLHGLTGWPYRLDSFARMVCQACGLELVAGDIPNGDFPVQQFYKSGVTGRQLMSWVAEIACRFCRATADDKIELAWYTPSGVTVEPTGDNRYFAGTLVYEDYEVTEIGGVRLRLAQSNSGALWPDNEADNPYVITGNAILLAKVTEDLIPYLDNITRELETLAWYVPCKVDIPARLDLRPGHLVDVVDKHGKCITTCIMTKIQTGNRDSLESTGSVSRDSSSAVNNQSTGEVVQNAIDNQTRQEIFDKLTEGGKIQGIYVQDNKWYINAEHVQVLNLKAGSVTAGKLSSTNGKTYFDLDNGSIVTNNITATGGTIGGWNLQNSKLYAGGTNGIKTVCVQAPSANTTFVFAAGGESHESYIDCPFRVTKNGEMYASKGEISGWKIDDNSIRYGNLGASGSMWLCRTGTTSSPDSYGQSGIAETAATKTGWCMTVGNKFGVDRTGALFASGATLIGTIKASSGNIGEWEIQDGKLVSASTYSNKFKMNGNALSITYTTTPDSQGITREVTEEITWKDLILTVKSLM